MKIAAICGSPRSNGNTAKVMDYFKEHMGDKYDVDTIKITSYEVNGCLGCGVCEKSVDEPGCIQKDDAVPILKRMMDADVVLYASPLYCWGFSAQIKSLIDRHFCMVKGYGTTNCKSLLDGKKTALLVTCDGPIDGNADLIQQMFERLAGYGKCQVIGKYIVPFCMDSNVIATKGEEIAKTMAADVMDALKI